MEPPLATLVVDDDALTRTLMKRILTRMVCVVSCEEKGEVALEMTGAPGHDGKNYTVGCGDNRTILEQPWENEISDESKYVAIIKCFRFENGGA
jgi:osomolarity two-component system sensor histidine kinase SLN1